LLAPGREGARVRREGRGNENSGELRGILATVHASTQRCCDASVALRGDITGLGNCGGGNCEAEMVVGRAGAGGAVCVRMGFAFFHRA